MFFIKLKYRLITLSLIVLVCAVISYVFMVSTAELGTIYKEQTLESIRDTKKTFLKDTINNLISEIDTLRETRKLFYEDLVEETSNRFSNLSDTSDEIYLKLAKTYFDEQSTSTPWTIFMWDIDSKAVVYNPHDLKIQDWYSEKETLIASLSTFEIISHGHYMLLIGVDVKAIDAEVKNLIYDEIHELTFSEDTYIWVNEVVNFDGGKEYAIRRIHPNNPETEGMILSTETTDIKGNLPYLEELEGINKSGEVFFTYYFKKLNSDVIAEKLTYAKLYKPYNWIIDMGIYLDDLQAFVDSTSRHSQILASNTIAILVIFLSFIVFAGFGMQIFIERLSYRTDKKNFEAEINYDALTGVYSRSYGIKALALAFNKFKKTGHQYTVMMFDIDSFKQINDKYGHAFGDVTLRSVTDVIFNLIRTSDSMIRWGGDEFIIIFDGLQKEMSESVALKVLDVVSNLKLEVDDIVVTPTISIGISYFEHFDKDFNDMIKRADLAMYHAKANGKNQISMH